MNPRLFSLIPFFQVSSLLIFCYGLHCFNVYLFKRLKFNYRLIFRCKMHYTHMGEKLRYLTTVSFVFLCLTLYFVILESNITKLKESWNWLESHWVAYGCLWFVFFFFFVPSRLNFKPQEYHYFLQILKNIVLFKS